MRAKKKGAASASIKHSRQYGFGCAQPTTNNNKESIAHEQRKHHTF